MSISTRLARLRPPPAPRSGLAERIRRLELARHGPECQRGDQWPAELQAETVAPGVLLVERYVDLTSSHGSRPLEQARRTVKALAGETALDPRRALFIDTETTGLSGGSGTCVFLLGLARVRDDKIQLRQYLLTRFAGEPAMLRAAADWLQDELTLVSYNGKSFDLPLLATRCRLAGVDDPFAGRRHLDLLYPVRRAFSPIWTDCRLGTAEARLLGFERQGDLPGAEAPAAWLDWVRHGVGHRLPAVCRHNRWDLISLAALLPVLDRIYCDPRPDGVDLPALARWRLAHGDSEGAFRILHSCRQRLDRSGLLLLARMYKRRAMWKAAVSIWYFLAAGRDAEAREELAKYYEHRVRDYDQALRWSNSLPESPARSKRCHRLRLKYEIFHENPRSLRFIR